MLTGSQIQQHQGACHEEDLWQFRGTGGSRDGCELLLAQDDSYCVRAKIPFDFYADDQQLHAGTYLIEVSYNTHSVTFRNNNTGRTYYSLAQPASGVRSGDARLEFDVTANTHLLT
jgi:hypothetical protein